MDLDAIVVGDDRLSAAERIQIYADAYFYRLLDVMKEDYPATLLVLGADHFEALVADYLLAYPPCRPSVFYAGQHLARFLRGHSTGERFPFVADLALLERSLIEVFHAPDAPALSEAFLRTIPASRWPALALRIHPAARILNIGWRVGEIRRAADSNLSWQEPARAQTTMLVWRNNNTTWYRELDTQEHAAFVLLSNGASFAEICEVIAETVEDDPAAAINRLLHRWIADGVLSGDVC